MFYSFPKYILLLLSFLMGINAFAWQSRWVGASGVRHYQLTCCNTRQETQVFQLIDDATAHAAGFDRTYTGRGVLVGIVDTGIEYGHLNFRHPQTGNTRLKGAALYRPKEGAPDSIREYYTEAAILDTLTTDYCHSNHGTHTAGIAAGSYPGLGLQGMAPDADLMLCGTSSLTDDRLIDAIDQTFRRADELEQPCVINLSIGSPVDWKDGLTPFCLACDSLTDGGSAPGRIIVVSAGNDGGKAFSVQHEFVDHRPVYSLLMPSQDKESSVYYNPNVDVYCSDSLPVSLDYVLYDTLRHTFSEFPFEQHLSDSLEAGHDGRRHLCIDADTCRMSAYPNQLVAVRLKGQPGTSFTAYYINDESLEYAMRSVDDDAVNWLEGSSVASISDLSCTDAVLSVGAYSAVDAVTNIFGNRQPAWAPQGRVCSFSSYGLSWQGVPKPDVICPGASVISSTSSYYTDKIKYYTQPSNKTSPMVHIVTPGPQDAPWYLPDEPGRSYYWMTSVGTSQSSPTLAGIIALWLEACPTLSVRDVRRLLAETSRFDDDCLKAPGGAIQAGFGKVDALAGMRWVQRLMGIQDVCPDDPQTESVYDLWGRPVSGPSRGLVIERGQKKVYRE